MDITKIEPKIEHLNRTGKVMAGNSAEAEIKATHEAADGNSRSGPAASDPMADVVREQQAEAQTGSPWWQKGVCGVGMVAWADGIRITPGAAKLIPIAGLALQTYLCKEPIKDVLGVNKKEK